MTSIAIYLVPVYIIIFCVLVNYIVIRISPTLRSRLSTSHRARYILPYPLILIGLPPSPASTSTSSSVPQETSQRNGNPVSFFFSSLRPASSSSQSHQRGHGLGGRTRTTSTSNSNTTPSARSNHNGNGSTINGVPGQGDPLTDILARHLHLGNNHANGAGRGGRIARGLGLGRGRGAAASSGTSTTNTTSASPAGTTTNTTTTTTTTTPAVSGRVITRGGRRWGRTGSQRSTQTLPLYEEDAGAEDVVLIRKRESLRQMGRGEETDIVEGQNEDEDDHYNAGPSSQLLPEEDETGQTAVDVDDNNNDNDNDVRPNENYTGTTTSPTADSPDRGRTRASSVSTSDIPDRGWGEAPSYDTAVPPPRFDFDVDPESSPAGGRTGSSNANATGGGGFRAFVGRLTGGRAEQHRRGFSTGSTATDDDRAGLMRMSTSGTSTGRNRGWSNASSMRNVSGTSTPGMMSQVSLLSVNNINNSQPMTRFSSRLSSFGGATPNSASSSVINLNGPISGPLPGSLIRSSFDAPRAGFSAKQVEFLSSTDSLGKYGVRVDIDGNPIDSGIGMGRARGSSVGSTARPSVDEGAGIGTGWRALAREEQAAASSSGTVPAPLHIQIPRADDVEIEVVPPTPTFTSGQ